MIIYLKYLLIGLIIFSIIFYIFGLSKKDTGINVEEILKLYKIEKDQLKTEIGINSEIIDKLNKKIQTLNRLNKFDKD